MSKLGIFLCTVFFVSIVSATPTNGANPWDDFLSSSFRNASIEKKEAIEPINNLSYEELRQKLYATFNETVNGLNTIFNEVEVYAKNYVYYGIFRNKVDYKYKAYEKCTEELNNCLVGSAKNLYKNLIIPIVNDVDLGFETIRNTDALKATLTHTEYSTSDCTDETKTFISALENTVCIKLEVFETKFNSNLLQNLIKILDSSFASNSLDTNTIQDKNFTSEFAEFPCDKSTFQTCIKEYISPNPI